MLSAIAPDGAREVIAKLPGATDCDFDDKHDVIWILGKSLWAFEPDTGRVVEVGTNTKTPWNWGVTVNDGNPVNWTRVAGNFDYDFHCATLLLFVADEPTLKGQYIGDTADPPCSERESEYKKALAEYNKVKLEDAAYVVALQKRSFSFPKPPPPATPAPKVKVSNPSCTNMDPPCGTAEHVGGSVWRIVGGSSQGDGFHTHYQLFDTRHGMFWDPRTDTTSPKHFPDDGEISNDLEGGILGFDVSPDGSWATFRHKRLSLTPAKVLGPFEGTVCGWK